MENPSNIQPDQVIVVEGDAGFVPKAEPSDAGKVLGVVNASGDVGWVEASGGQLTQVQADWAETDPAQVSYIDNKPDLSVYATSSAVDTALAGKQDVINDLSDIRSGAEAGSTAVQPSALDSYATTSAMNTALAGKQDTISDLSDIRAGAAKGDTAVQPAALNDYATTAAMNSALAGKQDVINDLADIRSGASAGATAVQPSALDSYATTSAMNTALAGKQDVINDLADIRAGASAGATAVQPAALEDYATVSAMDTALAGKQNTISDLDTIRAGAAAGATAAQPSDLPSSDELLPSASSGDAGKILSVDASGNPEWITPSGGTTYSEGDGIDIDANNVISAKVDGTTIGIDASTKEIKLLATIPSKTSDLQNDSGFITSSDIPAQVNADWTSNSGASEILHKPDLSIYAQSANLATVATTGDYDDLVHKPTIPQAQVNSDWNSNSGVSQILNKPSLATVATTGDYSDLLNKPSIPAAQIQADWNETNASSKAYIQNKPTIPAAVTVDQTYNASSANPQSGTAVAEAVASISVDEVPAVTSSDDGKVLKATYSGGTGSYSWETETGATYTAGDAIDLTNNEISVDYDTNTLDVVGQTVTENVTQQSASGLFLLPSSVAALLSQQGDTQVTVHVPANTLKDENFLYDERHPTTFKFTLYATDSPSETSVSLFSTPVESTTEDSEPSELTDQDIVFNLPASVANQWSQNLSSAVAFNICGGRNGTTYTDSTLTVIGDLTTSPITFTFVDASATKLAVKNPLPASTSAEADKVLTVDSSGTPVWAAAQGGGGTVDQTYDASSTNAQSGTAVAGALATVNQVPASTSSDEDKVLTVNSSGNPVWAEAAAPYSKPLVAGANITITDGANDVTIAATVPTVDQTYSAVSANAQSGVAVASAISGINAVPASTSADQDKVLTVNSSGTPVWAAAQGGGGSGGDSEFPYDPGYMHTGWNKMVVRFGDTSYDPTTKSSASSFTSIVALNEPGVYEYTLNLSSSHGSQLFQNEWNDITNNPVDILQLTSDNQLTGNYYGSLFMGCTGLRSVWNIRGYFGSMLSWFRMCTNLEVVSGHIPERLAALNQDNPSFIDYGIKVIYGAGYVFYKCIALKKAETLISFTSEASSNGAYSFFEDCSALKVGAPVLGYVSNATNAYKNCVKLVRLYGLSDLEGIYPAICVEYNPPYANYTTHTCNVDSMFLNCYKLSDLNGLDLNYGKLINLYCTFTSCESIEKLPLLNIADNTNCSYAFNCCYALKEVPIMPYDKVVNAEGMFGSCRSITDVTGLTGLATLCTNVSSLLADCWWVVKGALDLYTALQASSLITAYSSAFTRTGVNGWNDQRSQIPSSWGGTGA